MFKKNRKYSYFKTKSQSSFIMITVQDLDETFRKPVRGVYCWANQSETRKKSKIDNIKYINRCKCQKRLKE